MNDFAAESHLYHKRYLYSRHDANCRVAALPGGHSINLLPIGRPNSRSSLGLINADLLYLGYWRGRYAMLRPFPTGTIVCEMLSIPSILAR
jgi:hypothetical protein